VPLVLALLAFALWKLVKRIRATSAAPAR
jgi:hypothetical protein